MPQLSGEAERELERSRRAQAFDRNINYLTFQAVHSPAYQAWAHDRMPIPSHILPQIRNYQRVTPDLRILACHGIIHSLKPITEAALLLDQLQERKKFSGLEEYADVFDDLTRVLRCKNCFGDYFFNQTNRDTGEQFTWGAIAQALASDPLGYVTPVRPKLYILVGRPPNSDDNHILVHSLQHAAKVLGMGFEEVKVQIVKYFVDLEVPNGPKHCLRLGRWDKLLDHISAMHRRLCRRMTHISAQAHRGTFEGLVAQVQATRDKWFVQDRERYRWVLSDKAVEVGMRLAASGDPRGECRERGRVRLFDYGSKRMVPPESGRELVGDDSSVSEDSYFRGDSDDEDDDEEEAEEEVVEEEVVEDGDDDEDMMTIDEEPELVSRTEEEERGGPQEPERVYPGPCTVLMESAISSDELKDT